MKNLLSYNCFNIDEAMDTLYTQEYFDSLSWPLLPHNPLRNTIYA